MIKDSGYEQEMIKARKNTKKREESNSQTKPGWKKERQARKNIPSLRSCSH